MSESQQTKMSFTDFRMGVNVAAWLSHLLSVPLNVLLHFGLGERYIGIPGLVIIPCMLVYTMAFQSATWAPMLLLVLAYIVMCVVWRGYAVFRRHFLKRPVHSRYAGRPLLHLLAPRLSQTFINYIEAGIAITLGLAFTKVNAPLGGFLFLAGLGQTMSLNIEKMVRHAKELDRIDAMLEQRDLAERSRDMLP